MDLSGYTKRITMLLIKKPLKKSELPELYPSYKFIEGDVNTPDRYIVGNHEIRDGVDYIPQIGIQTDCLVSEADIVFMIGDATMGKTFTLFFDSLKGLGRPRYTGTFLSRRLTDMKKGTSLIRDAKEMYDGFAGCEFTGFNDNAVASWAQWNSVIRFTHSNFNIENPGEWSQFQEFAKKNQSSWIGWDELTDAPFKMWAYWMSRNRDSSGMRPRFLATMNFMYDHWSRSFCDWYVNPQTHELRDDRIGKMRYLYIGNASSPSEVIWGNSKDEVLRKADIKITKKEAKMGLSADMMIKSFVLLTGEAADNRQMVQKSGGGSIANLHNSGDAKRLKGRYWGPVEDEQISVTHKMITGMFEDIEHRTGEMRATFDASQGGDNAVLIIWDGWHIIDIIHLKADYPEDWIKLIRNELNTYKVPESNLVYDGNGGGYFLKDLRSAIPIIGQEGAFKEYDEQGNIINADRYFNKRSQLLGTLEALLKTGKISCGIDPKRKFAHGKNKQPKELLDIFIEEKEVFKRTIKNQRLYYYGKGDYKKKYGISPDEFDSMLLAAYWALDARPRKTAPPTYTAQDYYREMNKNRNRWR